MCTLVLALCFSLPAHLRTDEAQAREYYKRQNAEIHRLWINQQYAKALDILEELRRNPGVARLESERISVLYNLACAYSRLGKRDAAIDYLEQAEAAGFDKYAIVLKDPDFDAIRSAPEFHRLVSRLKHRSESACADDRLR
jgi:tetratricopeptide (TPR) repeat protein